MLYPKYRRAASFPAMTETAGGAPLGALSHRNFRLFFLGQAVSLSGTWMQTVAPGWLVLQLTNSPFFVGLVSAVGSLGVLLFTLYAGVVAGAWVVGVCFFLNGVSYLAVIWGLLAMRLPPHAPRPAHESAWVGFQEVVRFIRGDRRIATLVVQTALLSIFGFPFLVMMPVFARDVLRAGASGYGALMAAVGIGAMLGALMIAVYSRRVPKGRLLIAGGVAFGVLVGLFALSRVFVLSVGLLALAGCAMIVNNALTNTTLQTLVPDQLRGRVMGFYSFVFVGMAPLGAFQAGVFAEHAGAPAAVAVGGLVSALVVLVAAWRVPELRKT